MELIKLRKFRHKSFHELRIIMKRARTFPKFALIVDANLFFSLSFNNE